MAQRRKRKAGDRLKASFLVTFRHRARIDTARHRLSLSSHLHTRKERCSPRIENDKQVSSFSLSALFRLEAWKVPFGVR